VRQDDRPNARGLGLVRGEPGHGASLSAPSRFAEFDALRATAIGLVVTLHSALAYTHHDIPRLLWGVREPSPGAGFDRFCWWAMAVSVPLFFTISGFFASMAVAARGATRFWEGRVRRVVIPSFAAVPVILPLSFAAWAVGWLVTGRCTYREVQRLRFRDPAIESALYGPAHLWFVEYLIPILWVYGLSCRRSRPAVGASSWLARWWAPLALAIPATALMFVHRRWTGVDAGLDRHNALFPEPLRLLHFAAFFLVGSAIHRTPGLLARFERRGFWTLAATVPVFAFRGWMLPLDWEPEARWTFSLLAAGAGALGSWLSVFGLIGTYHRVFGRPHPVARYLAESSFWVYLVHLPIVGLLQADLFGVPIAPGGKFALTLGVTVALGLSSYQLFVRGTALGRFLDGRSAPAVPREAPQLGSGPVQLTRRRPNLNWSRPRRRR